MRNRLLTATLALGVLATPVPASASSSYVPKPHQACRAGYTHTTARVTRHRWVRRHGHRVLVVLRHHGKIVTVSQARCVLQGAQQVQGQAPLSAPALTMTPAVVAPASAQRTVRASLDPSFTQDPLNNLKVTFAYSATASGTIPAGVLTLAVAQPSNGANVGGCSMDVAGAATGGTCTVDLPAYGVYAITVTYTGNDPTVAPATQTDTQTIQPLPATVSYQWGTDSPTHGASIAAIVIGSEANTTLSDPNFEGAATVSLSDNLGDGCQATVSGTKATCQMPVTGTPSSYTIAYPGGTSTSGTRSVQPGNGTQQVTYAWPAQNVPISNPSVTVQQATVEQCGGAVTNQTPNPWPSGSQSCSYNNPSAWPNPLQVTSTSHIQLDAVAFGSLSSDRDPSHGGGYVAGYLTFTVTGGSEGVDYSATEQQSNFDGSADCSKVTTQSYLGGDPSQASSYGPDEPNGTCALTFHTPGTYTVKVTYHSQDPNYADATMAQTETIQVD